MLKVNHLVNVRKVQQKKDYPKKESEHQVYFHFISKYFNNQFYIGQGKNIVNISSKDSRQEYPCNENQNTLDISLNEIKSEIIHVDALDTDDSFLFENKPKRMKEKNHDKHKLFKDSEKIDKSDKKSIKKASKISREYLRLPTKVKSFSSVKYRHRKGLNMII